MDGFPLMASMMFTVEGLDSRSDLRRGNLTMSPTVPRIALDGNEGAASLFANSSTILVDMETGERVPHFVEQDAWEYDDSERWGPVVDGSRESWNGDGVWLLQPIRTLHPGRSYAVGVIGVRASSGDVIVPVTPVRSGTPELDALASAGVPTHDLQVREAVHRSVGILLIRYSRLASPDPASIPFRSSLGATKHKAAPPQPGA